MSKVTIKDIAKRCRVSPATVSLVLSGNKKIPDSTASKILRVIERTGYIPNISARNLVKKSTESVAVILPRLPHIFSNPFFGEALSGIYDYFSNRNYKIIIEVASPEFVKSKRYISLFREKSIDGMLYVGSTLADNYLECFDGEQYPFILVGSNFDNLNLSYVTGNNIEGGVLAANYLINMGHRKIGYITGHFNVISARDRFQGFKTALKKNKISFDESLVANADFDEDTGYFAAKTLLKKNVTAIFCGNDLMALGALEAAEEAGMKVPEDLCVIGMDNIRFSPYGKSRLTTVDYNVYEMGRVASEKLFSMIENKNTQQVKVVLPVSLIIRETCAPPRKEKIIA